MKTTPFVVNKATPQPATRHNLVLQWIGKSAVPSIALGAVIVLGGGCSGTQGFKVRLTAPVVNNSQVTNPTDDGWYHPPENPGYGQGG